ncbi:nickel pincer cofactor biosynthesis protein LarB [Actinoplanes palleronii]|uniref:nickel pincer cofactor biosynthesis protein LarB n=1 Tax=Actinoplanes palleronii TaxID=113570 RepID=UPI0031DF9E2C
MPDPLGPTDTRADSATGTTGTARTDSATETTETARADSATETTETARADSATETTETARADSAAGTTEADGAAEAAGSGPATRGDDAEAGGGVIDYAELDLGRTARRGYPEAVYCAGKTARQVGGIAARVRARPDVITLFTRADAEHAAAVLAELPDARHDADAGLLAWPATPPAPTGGLVVVVAAGTSDLRAAREAELTARYLGRPTELVVDVGVAGLHRILARLELLRRARVVVVAAGMDGALPSVVAGLISVPVVGLPTSVGYGAAFGGLAPLLAMLNACAPGVAVVNIDNGYGAGHLAAQIAAPFEPGGPSGPGGPA